MANDFETTMILVTTADGGLVFEGYPIHWRDCFFDNADPFNVLDYCLEQGLTVRFTPNAGTAT